MSKSNFRIFISVGEESADLHASRLCEELKSQCPSLELFGFGGKRMRDAGVEILYPLPELAIIGFVEVIKHIPSIWKIESLAKKSWDERKPDVIIFVDYPGLHFRLAKEAKARGIPILYYIAPQVWAWKERRIDTMRKWLQHLYVIFPFEEPYFNKHGIPVSFVGHPLIERIPPAYVSTRNTIDTLKSPLIGLMPGSRLNEIQKLLPVMIKASQILKNRIPEARFALLAADALTDDLLQRFALPAWIEIIRDTNYQFRRNFSYAWCASGTATVENALLAIPMTVVYKINPINMFLGRRLVRIPYIGMVNLIAQKGICPELIQEQCQPEMLARSAEEILTSPTRYEEMIHDLKKVREKIGEASASKTTASKILEFLRDLK